MSTDNEGMRALSRRLFGQGDDQPALTPQQRTEAVTGGNVVPSEGTNPVARDRGDLADFVHEVFWGEPK